MDSFFSIKADSLFLIIVGHKNVMEQLIDIINKNMLTHILFKKRQSISKMAVNTNFATGSVL